MKIIYTVGWLIALLLLSLCVFGLYPDFKEFPKINLTRPIHIAYQSLSRITWAIGVAYIIYACENSKNGFFNF